MQSFPFKEINTYFDRSAKTHTNIGNLKIK